LKKNIFYRRNTFLYSLRNNYLGFYKSFSTDSSSP